MKDNPLFGALAASGLLGLLKQSDWFLALLAPLVLGMLVLTGAFIVWATWRVLSQGLRHFWGAADAPPGS